MVGAARLASAAPLPQSAGGRYDNDDVGATRAVASLSEALGVTSWSFGRKLRRKLLKDAAPPPPPLLLRGDGAI